MKKCFLRAVGQPSRCVAHVFISKQQSRAITPEAPLRTKKASIEGRGFELFDVNKQVKKLRDPVIILLRKHTNDHQSWVCGQAREQRQHRLRRCRSGSKTSVAHAPGAALGQAIGGVLAVVSYKGNEGIRKDHVPRKSKYVLLVERMLQKKGDCCNPRPKPKFASESNEFFLRGKRLSCGGCEIKATSHSMMPCSVRAPTYAF